MYTVKLLFLNNNKVFNTINYNYPNEKIANKMYNKLLYYYKENLKNSMKITLMEDSKRILKERTLSI